MSSTSHEPSGATLHASGSGGVLVALALVLAGTTCVEQILLAKAVSPAVEKDSAPRWNDIRARGRVDTGSGRA